MNKLMEACDASRFLDTLTGDYEIKGTYTNGDSFIMNKYTVILCYRDNGCGDPGMFMESYWSQSPHAALDEAIESADGGNWDRDDLVDSIIISGDHLAIVP